jgi:hypothetical protein
MDQVSESVTVMATPETSSGNPRDFPMGNQWGIGNKIIGWKGLIRIDVY